MSEPRLAEGLDYLGLLTTLLQRVRRSHPTAGLWEAADLQWWWRTPRVSDDTGQLFWFDEAGSPEAAVILTAWGRAWGCDPIVLPTADEGFVATVWQHAMDRIADLRLDAVESLVRDDDPVMQNLALGSGFHPEEDVNVPTWMDAGDRPPVARLADGFRLLDRVGSTAPHHMIPRGGEVVAERFAQLSLYRPDLDLSIEAPDGDVAGYGMFWLDPVTGVGLVEPMRTEDRYQRRGLARHLLTAGLERLALAGAQRLKISYEDDNPAAKNLYLGTGFRPDVPSTNYTRAG